ncbi:sacsin N-terminal ATP-binding-like domain-containing protein [Marinifilum sp. D737]|uniref:sacsin N-terminal ATP-binding-like domain-containing protein n=1 Tax=Marinifilum sp. D737 TaxID=2969628 RepID=UPI0022759746|nr:DUF3883 domain-containing protein [Marinifilum sp. D737]MCY1636588.1 DUF3883 domain-containing protein [Marinifilum sp. D737]
MKHQEAILEETHQTTASLEEAIKKEADDQLAETMWGKPANDIITGIANNSSVPANRAIWELVQNARDVSKVEERAKVRFTRRLNEFVFQHNGQPFDRKSIQSLILQTSSKVRNDIVQVGQYGTGFLTTHKFGLQFHLQSSLDLKHGNYFYNFGVEKDFLIDRSSKDKIILSKAIKDAIDISQQWGADASHWSSTPLDDTVFIYKHNHQIERDNVAEAFKKSVALVPYVLSLNPLLQSITFADEVEHTTDIYEHISTIHKADFGDTQMDQVTIRRNCDGKESTIQFLLLKSKSQLTEDNSESKVTVILPCVSTDGTENVIQLSDDKPQLYLYLPLLGTENWGWNFIVHAPSFTCDKDTRDSLLFVGNGQNNDDQAENNKQLIQLAGGIIKEFITHQLTNYTDRKHFGRVNFLADGSEKLKAYYTQLQTKWVTYFESQPLVKKEDEYIAVSTIKVLDKELYEACENDSKLLDALYILLSKEIHNITLPEQSDLIYWSRCTDEWYRGNDNPYVLTLSQICKIVENTPIKDEDIVWLLKLCSYLKAHPHSGIDLKKLVPNEQLKLSQAELVKPTNFNSTYRLALQTLVPQEVEKFIHNSFYIVLDDAKEYGFDDAKNAITVYLTSLDSKSVALKNAILANASWQKEDYENVYLNPEQINAILDIYKMLLPLDGDGFTTKTFNLLSQFYEYTPSVNERLDKELFDIRTCYTALLNDALYKFTLLEDKSSWCTWNLQMVQVLFNFKEANSFLRNYLIYPNQMGKHCYASELKRERTMPLRLKELYDTICRGVKDEDKSKSICHELVAKEYENFFVETGELDGSALADEIQTPFAQNEVRTIGNHPHQKLIIEIIELLNDENDGSVWRNLFGTINSIKAQLMLSVINSPQKRESIFQIMKVQDETKLKIIAELSMNDDLVRIIELGTRELELEIQDKNDFTFKKQLGEYVEEFLLEQLKETIGENSLTVHINNEQNGQDLIIYINNNPVYYIEVKSRWSSKNSVLMSTAQHQKSFANKDQYALCVVDMSDYDKDFVIHHIYPDVKDVLSRISMLENIGALNDRMKDAVDGKEDKDVYIASGYQVLVPQKVIAKHGKTFEVFIDNLNQHINSKIQHLN